LAEKEVVRSGLSYTILRPTAVYGKGTSDYNALVKIVKKGFAVYITKPCQRLSFVHAEDVAIVVFLTDKLSQKNQVFNVSDGVDYTLASIYEIMASALKVKLMLKLRIPFFLVLAVAQYNHYIERFFKIENALNSFEKANEVTAPNWKCSSKKLKDRLGFKAVHTLKEIID
jgi:nucleoside-diphosphate-sugar epimerase